MRRAKKLILLAVLLLAATFSRGGDSIVWDAKTGSVSADVQGEKLWPLLTDIAHQTGWHIFLEPGLDRKADVKFSKLNAGEALKKLLGDLNFAFVPQTNEADHLYVFATTMRAATQRVNVATTNKTAVAKHVPNELIIKVKPGTDIDALAKALGAKVTGRDDALGIYRLQFDDAAATDTALAKLKSRADVATVEYNYQFDPPQNPQRLANGPAGSPALALNPPGDTGRVIVGLVDTAIQPLGNGLDKFILTPISVAGEANPNSVEPTHATSMAATVLNGVGMQTGNPSVVIQPVDVYGADALATTWNMARGIQVAVNNGANPISISSGGQTYSEILNQVIQDAQSKGIVFFGAAGNQPVNTPTYPAADTGVIAVAATDGNKLASYSNYGAFITIALPGTSVVTIGNGSWVVQGTSPATAFAAGIAAGAKSGSTMSWSEIFATMQQRFPVPKK